MKISSDMWHGTSVKMTAARVVRSCRPSPACADEAASARQRPVTRHSSGFTLIELLVVIAILGILAGLAVPALKNLGKSDANVSAARQLLDDVGRARQLAMSQRTTVYMVFVPTNFWNYPGVSGVNTPALTNLCDKQLTGYNFVSFRTVGDQPGRGQTNYLSAWQSLPDNTFIPLWKFNPRNNLPFYVPNQPGVKSFPVLGFDRTVNVMPFPVLNSPAACTNLPYIAFNYLGQLTSGQDEYIPLAHGSVGDAVDGTKALQFASPTVTETPPGNSTNSAYNLVHIDGLTGRAVLEFQKIP
jgi:prepilin-type N-terminal cleavage/methylation domain-containing protein